MWRCLCRARRPRVARLTGLFGGAQEHFATQIEEIPDFLERHVRLFATLSDGVWHMRSAKGERAEFWPIAHWRRAPADARTRAATEIKAAKKARKLEGKIRQFLESQDGVSNLAVSALVSRAAGRCSHERCASSWSNLPTRPTNSKLLVSI